MIKIDIPKAEVSIIERKQVRDEIEPVIKSIEGFIDLHKIPRDKGGIILFYNNKDELLFAGKARKLRQRVKKHFEDTVSPIKNHRNEGHEIAIIIVKAPMKRKFYKR